VTKAHSKSKETVSTVFPGPVNNDWFGQETVENGSSLWDARNITGLKPRCE